MIKNDVEIAEATNLFTEIELTDEQLGSICGGIGHDDHRGYDDHRGDNNRRWRRGYWDRRHCWHWYN